MNAVYRPLGWLARIGATRRRQRAATFRPADVRRIWVHKPDHLGDILLARPALAALRAAFPDAEIVVACRSVVASLLAADPIGYRTFAWRSPFLDRGDGLFGYVRAVRKYAPDLVVNLRHDVRDILLCATLGAPFLVTYDHWGVAGFATHPGRPPRDDRPEVENHLQLLAETLNVPPAVAPKLPTASRPTEPSPWDSWPADAPRLLFHAAARTAAKLWPVAHWRELARRCADAGWPAIALLGSVDDRALNQQIATGLPNVADWSGRFSLPELATVLGGADLVIGVDSGPGHLAHAVGTRVVSLMSGTNCATRWAPDPAATLCHTVPCAPCRLTRCPVSGHPCLREITPDRVLAAMPRGAAA